MLIMRRTLLSTVLAVASLTAAYAEPVDVNTATAQELATALQGVGPARAAAIIAYREQHGPFLEIDELTKVSGIGMKLVEANKDNLRIELSPAVE